MIFRQRPVESEVDRLFDLFNGEQIKSTKKVNITKVTKEGAKTNGALTHLAMTCLFDILLAHSVHSPNLSSCKEE